MTPAPGSDQKELETLLAGLVEGVLPAAQKQRLGVLLKDSPEARRFYKRYLEVHAMLDWESGVVAAQDAEPDTITLADLLRMEEQAEAQLVHDVGHLRGRGKSPWQIRGALRWVIENPAVWSAAAMLAIAAILVMVFTGNDPTPTNPSNPTAQQDDTPATQANQTKAVATLTNTHHAKWAGPASAAPTRGSKLHPNQRLTLTEGFAEITTYRGAIAFLEAPATIELLDSDNALRLHTGKLVGICETESSKGFLIRTPHLDITDLGTRFGVDASSSDATEVHVFEGSVEVSRSASGARSSASRVLLKDQALRAEADTEDFVVTEMQADRFARRPGNLLLGTGRGQAEGEIANHWRVVAVDGQPVTQHGGLILVPEHHDGSSDPNTSQWLKINDALNPPGKRSAVFTCRASFEVPDEVDPTTHELVIRCEADFSVKAVRVNGQTLKVPNNRIGNGWITLTVTDRFAPGENTIEVDVKEVFKDIGNTGNSSSLRVEVEARRR